jgi:hypothetical protein
LAAASPDGTVSAQGGNMIAVLLSILATSASADIPSKYECKVIIVAKDLPNGSDVKEYVAPALTGSHGGSGFEFTFENHKVGILSDAKWMAISWMRDGKYLAKATFASSLENQGAQVLILGNPADDEEQVSLDCAAP